MDKEHTGFESSFNINKVSFKNVSSEFEKKFKKHYSDALSLMSDSRDRLANSSGANSLGILEEMARHINEYNKNTDFEDSYISLIKDHEPFTET